MDGGWLRLVVSCAFCNQTGANVERERHILIVEDEEETREILTEYLSDRDYEVTSVSDGDAAIALLSQGCPYDLVLLDVVMPGKSGLAVLEAIQNLEESCAVVLMTAWAPLQSRIATLKLGSHDLLKKPFTPEVLEDVLRRTIPREV